MGQGLLFTTPFISNETTFDAAVTTLVPTITAWPAVLQYLTNVLYPPIFDGSQAMGYTNEIGRAAALISEAVFSPSFTPSPKAHTPPCPPPH